MVLIACSHSLKLEFLSEVYTLLMFSLCYSFYSKALNVVPHGYPCCAVTLQQNVDIVASSGSGLGNIAGQYVP